MGGGGRSKNREGMRHSVAPRAARPALSLSRSPLPNPSAAPNSIPLSSLYLYSSSNAANRSTSSSCTALSWRFSSSSGADPGSTNFCDVSL